MPQTSYDTFDDGICQGLFAVFEASKICITNIYRPPNATAESFAALLQFLRKNIEAINDDSFQVNVVGDFNLPCIDWESLAVCSGSTSVTAASASALLGFMSDYLLNQYVSAPTRGNNILDLFITNVDNLVVNISSCSTDMSDHNLVDVLISYNPMSSSQCHVNVFDKHEFRSLDFNKADFEEVNNQLRDIDWVEMRNRCTQEEFPELFTESLFSVCAACVPLKKVGNGKPRLMKVLRRKKKRLKARLNALISNNGSAEHILALKNKVAMICYEIKESIINNLNQKEQAAIGKVKSNPKFFYSYAKSFSKIKAGINMLFDSNGIVRTDPKNIADILQDQFSSVFSDPDSPDIKEPQFDPPAREKLFTEYSMEFGNEDILEAIKEIKTDSACGPDGIPAILLKECAESLCEPLRIIWEESMRTGIVPDYYKRAYVAPLHKKGSRAQAINYRPVSLTSHVVKLYERFVRKAMVNYIEDNNILSSKQHGFRSGKSCLTQLLNHFDEILLGLLNNKDTDAIYLDYAKAFDKVDHRLLLLKLRRYGFGESLIKWIESFLTDRFQTVVVDGQHSYSLRILSGVPQGTVLGPLLFILFIEDLQLCVENSKVSFFADDTRLSKHIASMSDVGQLQDDLDNVVRWSKENNMQLHEDKFELTSHKATPNPSLFQLPFVAYEAVSYSVSSGEKLVPVQTVRDLGVTITDDLSWSLHVSNSVKKARNTSAWVFSVFKTREPVPMLTLYKSLVRSIMEYCCPLWSPSKVGDIQALESIQRTFTSKIMGLNSLDYWQRLKELNLMSLQRRRERYIILFMWRILHQNVSGDVISVVFQPPSRNGIRAKVPGLSKSSLQRHQSTYDNSFAVKGPRLWNSIPSNLTLIADFNVFKCMLTNFLLTVPDKPPVRGYCYSNHNSLLDWGTNRNGWSDHLMAH